MGVVSILLSLAGVLTTLSVASNVIAFRRYRKKFLAPLDNPLDESHEVLATFDIEKSEEDGGFFFGLATAPAHVEDKLHDAWLEFAQSEGGDSDSEPRTADQPKMRKNTVEEPKLQLEPAKEGMKTLKVPMEAMIRYIQKFSEEGEEDSHNVAAWHNVSHPEERLRFWSDPETELKLAKDTGVTMFRMGVDWTRIMPVEPIDGNQKSVNLGALKRYKWIMERVHAYGMRVMLTLFHHSLPPWAGAYGGWKLEKTVNYFLEFTKLAVEHFAGLVDYWITFNEPHVFAMLTYCAGAWPGGHPDLIETATAVMPNGVFNQVMHWMAVAHSKAFDHIHEFSNHASLVAKVGIAHHASFMRPYGLFDVAAVIFSNNMTLFQYVDSISDKLDFIGINYYGQEVLSAPGLKLVDNDEYSESGRGVYPDGLYRMLLKFHERYRHLNLPFIITENGVADATDLIRRPYILEHLLAVRAAMDKGVPVLGYLFWTISDNWEWADGYGPKFGLVAVDRANNLARIPRPSYFLFSEVVRTGKVTRQQRDIAWNELQIAAAQGKTRPFYRTVNKHGLMYAGGLDVPIQRPFIQRDWRFGHYQVDVLKDPVSSIGRFLLAFLEFPSYKVNLFLAFCILFWRLGSFAGNHLAHPEKDVRATNADLNEENLHPAAVY
uniref:TSA: Wollemia nobilis Ref_Wollemi_Transcript_11775_2447 transcribed RNA sequence n=1 Tax=Wollemia nobilis TaxID=56998 RepID=A0A0C9RLY0_9CONI